MNDAILLEIPRGYRIIHIEETTTLEDAEKILSSDKQGFYTKVTKSNTEATLFKSYIVCPSCSTRVSISNEEASERGKTIPTEEILKWSSRQISFFDETVEDTLYINPIIKEPSSFSCDYCGNKSHFTTEIKSVEIKLENKAIVIKNEISDISELLSAKWLKTINFSFDLPLYEILTFDIENATVYASLENRKSELICMCDVSDSPEVIENGVLGEIISSNKIFKRQLKKMFQKVWGSNLPFSADITDIKKLYEMTMFIGYKADFYSQIPYKLNSVTIEDSFKDIAKKLHYVGDAVSIFEEADLPHVKSIKKVFFKNPGLLFYVEENEKLWQIMGDVNYYSAFLKSANVFEVLADIHMWPGILQYIDDYCSIKGTKSFLKNSTYRWKEMLNAAIDYICSSNTVKKAVQESWIKEGDVGNITQRKPIYSIPMRKPEEEIKDCTIDGYDFFWLRSSNDYQIAGNNLENCLINWYFENSPVVCVKKRKKYVAAIEISEGMIVQARGHKNGDINLDEKLHCAFEKWRNKYNLTWEPRDEFDDEDLD